MYSSLHNHSDFSFQDGFSSPKEYLQKASEIGLKAIALTEHGHMCSAPYFFEESKNYPNIKVIYGCELYECFDINVKISGDKRFHLIALAKNEQGRIALNKIITESNFKGMYYKPRVDINLIKPYAKDLIICSACLASKLAREEDYNKCIEYINEYKTYFPNYYLEMQSHNTIEQSEYNRKILKLSQDTNTDFVITTDSHAVSKSDLYYQARHVQVARDSDTMSESYVDCYMQTEDEIHNIMDNQIGYDNVCLGLNNTNKVADLIEDVQLPFAEPRLPKFPLENGFNTDYDMLKHLVEIGWFVRKIDKMSDEEQRKRRERLDYELSVINQMGFCSYFLIVYDFINWAKNNGVVVGDGRGSAGSSIVCYLTGITALDPIKYDLVFERFLNPQRISLPDCDCDVSDRNKVIKYLSDKYGENHVCQIMNFSYITPIVAIKDTARVLKIPYAVADSIAKKFTYNTFEECITYNPDIVVKYAEYKDLFDIASKLCGKCRFDGIHAGGVAITNEDVTYYMPMKLGKGGEHVIQANKKMSEKLTLVKFDLLGLATLTTIQEVKNDLNLSDWELDPNNNDFLNNSKMYDVLCSAKTNGVFQVESAGMKDLLIRLKPNSLEDVSAVLALYRPDSMFMLEDFIHNKHNPQDIKYIHPDMEKATGKTYNAIIYQEEIMDITRIFGGRDYGGADRFRKGIASKNIEMIKQETELLHKEIIDNGYSKEISDIICDNMHRYGGYCFCKAHSVEYGVICLRTAYLKAKYPLYFFKALLNLNKDKAGMLNKYILDAQDFNVEILQPNINHSDINFSIYNGKILFGLSAISGIGETVASTIINERNLNGKFTNLENLISRVPLTKSQIVMLIKAGALPYKRKYDAMVKYLNTLYNPTEFKPTVKLPSYIELINKYGMDIEKYKIGTKKYDYDKDRMLVDFNEIKKIVHTDKEQKRYNKYIEDNKKYLDNEKFWEFEALQIFIKDNPFTEMYKYITTDYTDVPIGDSCTIIGVISSVQKKKDKNKNVFCYINIYSSFGIVEGIVWSSQYKSYEDLIRKGSNVAIKCRKDAEDKIVINEMKSYNQWIKDRGIV